MNSTLTGLDFEGGEADNEHGERRVDTGPGEPHYYLTGLASASAGIKEPNRQPVVNRKTQRQGWPSSMGPELNKVRAEAATQSNGPRETALIQRPLSQIGLTALPPGILQVSSSPDLA